MNTKPERSGWLWWVQIIAILDVLIFVLCTPFIPLSDSEGGGAVKIYYVLFVVLGGCGTAYLSAMTYQSWRNDTRGFIDWFHAQQPFKTFAWSREYLQSYQTSWHHWSTRLGGPIGVIIALAVTLGAAWSVFK